MKSLVFANGKIPKRVLISGVVLLLVLALTWAFWPRAMPVDLGEVVEEPMLVTINEEGRTRVHDSYIVSTPIAGRLVRVSVEPGDPVVRDTSVVARMLPDNPVVLDASSREQARADVAAAEAGQRLARATRVRATADKELADAEFTRLQTLRESGTISASALDKARREARAADAELATAEATIAMRDAELARARARLGGSRSAEDDGRDGAGGGFPIHAPASGTVLSVTQTSATTLPAGAPILEIGDIGEGLEIRVDLISSDAVQVAPGNRVMIEDWGGADSLGAVVERIDPQGFTKVSALGVEEQRVQAVLRFDDAQAERGALGAGFRVEARIVVWEDEQALVVPSSALFRENGEHTVFVADGGAARLQRVSIGHDNGTQAEVLGGLQAGSRVVLYPSADLVDGMAIEERKTGD